MESKLHPNTLRQRRHNGDKNAERMRASLRDDFHVVPFFRKGKRHYRKSLRSRTRRHSGFHGADFLVLDANPLDDITNTRRIASVYLQCRALDRSSYR